MIYYAVLTGDREKAGATAPEPPKRQTKNQKRKGRQNEQEDQQEDDRQAADNLKDETREVSRVVSPRPQEHLGGNFLKDKDRGHWAIEENDDWSGEYFVNYWAPSKAAYSRFKKCVESAAKANGLEFDVCVKFGELDPEEDGEHVGRVCTCFGLDAAGSRAYWEADKKAAQPNK